MRKPFDNEYRLTQAFNDGCCRASYAKFGMKGHNYNVITNLLYLDFNGVIVAPLLGNILSGILNTLKILLFTRPIQIIKSAPLPLRLNIHQPIVFPTGFPRLIFRLYNSHTFKSIFAPFQKKSKYVFRLVLGRFAPNFFINHSSHSIPFEGLLLNKLFLGLKFRKYQALLLHKSEQYFRFFPNLWNKDDGLFMGFEQKKHRFIF